MLVTPRSGSSIQKRSTSVTALSPKAVMWHTGAGSASTRGVSSAAAIASARTARRSLA
jgi:hypothetical protein